MRHRLLSAIAVVAVLVSFAASAGERAADALSENSRALLGSSEAIKLTQQCSRASPGPVAGFWVPTKEKLDELDRLLPDYLAGQFERGGSYPGEPGDYFRQLAGFVIEDRRVIYVNAVYTNSNALSDVPPDWRTRAIVVCDGGGAFFGVEYDPEMRAFRNFSSNGI
jgi:hypothetical protein